MHSPGRSVDAELWAITSYFNPVGYRRRRENYRAFRERLAVPLVTVELAYLELFELGDGDADILVQLRGGDVMWQKERLLNIARKALPASCRKVAWIDCDLIFARDDWPDEASQLLESRSLVQLFRDVYHMPPDPGSAALDPNVAIERCTAVAFGIENGLDPTLRFEKPRHPSAGEYARGFAWAARRELLEQHGFFDLGILGGGDTAMVCAAFGFFDYVRQRHQLDERRAAAYRAWGEPYREAVAGSVDAIDGSLFHLWHGDLRNRRWRERHERLAGYGFDPDTDIVTDGCGVWEWSTDKPAMHEYVRSYFVSRAEDG